MSAQYIIDGYNLFHHRLFPRRYKRSTKASLAVEQFLLLRWPSLIRKNEVIIVFDGYPPEGRQVSQSKKPQVIYSRDYSADEKIKQMVERSINVRNITVVSDDNQIRFVVKALGAKAMSIEEFIGGKDKGACDHTKKEAQELTKPELTYSQMHKINQELLRVWLG